MTLSNSGCIVTHVAHVNGLTVVLVLASTRYSLADTAAAMLTERLPALRPVYAAICSISGIISCSCSISSIRRIVFIACRIVARPQHICNSHAANQTDPRLAAIRIKMLTCKTQVFRFEVSI